MEAKSHNVRFSIVIPYHNSAEFNRSEMMDELMSSIPDRDDLEVVLVDDNSDGPYELKRDFDKARVKHLPNVEGFRYAGTARNTGIQVSEGKFLTFADSDDRYDTAALDLLMDEIASEEDIDLVVAKTISFKMDESIGDRHIYIDGLLDEAVSTCSNAPLFRLHSPGAKFIKREFITSHGIEYGDTRVANDVLFCARLMASSPRTRISNKVVYQLRQGNEALTSDVGRDAARIRIQVARAEQDVLKAAGMSDLRWPIAHMCLRFGGLHPMLAAKELLISILRRDRLVSSKKGMLLKLFGHGWG